MPPNGVWLAVVGTLVLLVGLSMAFTGQPQSRTGLVLLVGCILWALFLVISEPSRDGRESSRDAEQRGGIPWGSLWPFIALLVIVLGTLLVVRLLR
jgi:hypothetical protein